MGISLDQDEFYLISEYLPHSLEQVIHGKLPLSEA